MKIFNVVAVSVCLSGLFFNTSCNERKYNGKSSLNGNYTYSDVGGEITINGVKCADNKVVNGECKNKIACTKPSNKKILTPQNFAFNKFTQIVNKTSATIKLTQGDSFAIKVTGDEAFVKELQITEKNNSLEINQASKCFENSDINIRVVS